MPGGGACNPETWKAGRGSRMMPASAAGGPRKKEVCPGTEGRWSVRLRGRRGAPGAAGFRAHGGGDLPSAERAKRGAQAAVPRPGVQRRGSRARFLPAVRFVCAGGRACPRCRRLSGCGYSVSPAPAVLLLFHAVPRRCRGCGRL